MSTIVEVEKTMDMTQEKQGKGGISHVVEKDEEETMLRVDLHFLKI